jgi:IMP dehydrogenase
MTRDNLVTAPEGTSLEEARGILKRSKVEKLPIVDKNGFLRGLITIKDIEKSIKYPNSARDQGGRLLVGAAIGITGDMLERAGELLSAGADVLVIDSAHGHTESIGVSVQKIKEKFPNCQIIAGNVATAEGAEFLIKSGADCVKVGIGPGSICTTRVVAGIGVPQFTAILNAAETADKYGVSIIADGGVKYSGDITKAIGAGASAVMMGSMFAGCEESPGENIFYHGRQFRESRGMGSISAMTCGSKDRYFQESCKKLVPEGVESRVPYKGLVSETIFQLIGGLRAGMGYCGARTIDELRQNAKFVKITRSGLIESHPHDVFITKEPPNYLVNGENN